MNLLRLVAEVRVEQNNVNIPKTELSSNSIHTILQIVFGVAGAVTVIVIVLAGLRFVVAAGDPQKTAQARNTIIYALIGLAVCILGYSIVTFVLTNI